MKIVSKDIRWAGKFLNYFWYHLSDGRIYEVCSRNRNPDPYERKSDAVSIVAFNEDRTAVCLVREYRVPLEGYCYSFPAGLREPNESIYDTAHRELFEETGLKILTYGKDLPASYQSPGITDESVSTIFVTASGEPTNANQTKDEDITPMWVTKEDARRILCVGTNISARCQMFLTMWVGTDLSKPLG